MADKTKMYVILGTAHMATTPGKCSPDHKFREYQFSRWAVQAIYDKMKTKGYNVLIDYMPDNPPSWVASRIAKTEQSRELSMRAKTVNSYCERYGTSNCIYISIHVNAAGADGKWHNAGGWSAYTSIGRTKSDALAECLYDAAQKHLAGYAKIVENGKKSGEYSKAQKAIRTETIDCDRDYEYNYYVLANTRCPAVLTENLFQDTKSDVAFLQSEEGRQAIVNLHVEGIENYIAKL